MAKPKMNAQPSFRQRRITRSVMTVLILLMLALIIYSQRQSLIHSAYSTGYLLLGALFFLAAFNLRKRLTFLPAIGTASMWMQIHIYVGLATFAIFAMHIGWKIPNGWFECTLAMLYLIVALSGVYGCLLYTSPSPRDATLSRMPSSA